MSLNRPTVAIIIIIASFGILSLILFSNPSAVSDTNDSTPETLPPVTNESPTFTRTIWSAIQIGESQPLPNTSITIQFQTDDTFSGSDGCNTFSGRYTTDNQALQIDPAMLSTKKACEDNVMTQADTFTQLLLTTNSFTLGDGILVLNQNNTAGLQFTGQTNSLAKTSWEITGYNNGNQAVVSPLLDSTLTLTFGDDGTISGNAGCNSFSGQYSLSSSTLSISPLAVTARECIEPDGIMQQEQAFLQALQSANTWQLMGDQLSLRTADDALAIIAIPPSSDAAIPQHNL